MLYALEYPELLEKLLILDIAPVVYNNEYHDIIDSLSSIDMSNLQTRSDADTLLQEKIEERILRHFLLQNLARTEDGFKWRINLASIRSHLNDIIGFPQLDKEAKFNKPALFIAGENSGYIKPEHHPEIFKLYPDAEIISIPDAGHWVHADQPQLVLQNIKDFLGA